MISRICTALVATMFCTYPSLSMAEELKVMVVFSASAAGVINQSDFLEDIDDRVSDIFSASGLTPPSFILFSGNPNMFEQGLSDIAVLKLGHKPEFRQFRDTNSADLLLFVVSQVNSSGASQCGAATATASILADHSPNYLADQAFGVNNYNIHKGFSDTRFIAYITLLQAGGCATLAPEVAAAHEIGHLLFGDHELTFDGQGNPNGEVGSTTDWDEPVTYNHPAVNGIHKTVMYSSGPGFFDPFYSYDGAEFSNGEDGYNQYAKFANYVDDVTYEYVANYREPASVASVDEPICTIEYTGCVSNTEQWSLSWNNQAPDPISNIFMEMQAGSNWYQAYEGDLVCAPLLVSAIRTFRVLGITETLGYTDACTIVINGGTDCGEEEGW